jgi:zinc protease
VTDEELTTAKGSLVHSLPSMFASVSGIGGALRSLWVYGLPDRYYQEYEQNIDAVTKDDVVRVAKQYIDLAHLAIVIVGDRSKIEGPLKATGIAPIVVLDIEGAPVAAQPSGY